MLVHPEWTLKLLANRDHDRSHLRDLIDVGLLALPTAGDLPEELATGLEAPLRAIGA